MSSQQTFLEKTLKASATFLNRWKGSPVRLWELTSGHRTLRLVVGADFWNGSNLVLCCLEPLRIAGPFEWSDCRIEVSKLDLPGGNFGFLITDAGAGFELACESLEIKENLKL